VTNALPSISSTAKVPCDQKPPIQSEKQILLNPPTTVVSETINEPLEKSRKRNLADDVILAKIRERFQSKARSLLEELKKKSSIDFDENGVTTIDDKEIKNSSISDLIAITFYPMKNHEVAGLLTWFDWLKISKLWTYVSNPQVLHTKEELPKDWYFIGT
jgi:hypothetical protein